MPIALSLRASRCADPGRDCDPPMAPDENTPSPRAHPWRALVEYGSPAMTSPTPRTEVAILGYGRFGRALGQLLAEAGVSHRAYDPVTGSEVPQEFRADSLRDLASGAKFVVVAVPV